MIFLKEIWQKFKENPDWWFFCAFLLTLPLSIRKIITFYPIKSAFNEFGSIPLYLSDILLLFTLFSWIFIILRNNSFSLSRLVTATPKLSTEKVLNWLKCSTWNIFKDKLTFIPAIFILWSFLSIFWSDNHLLAFFRSIKLLEFFLLFIYVRFRLFHYAKGRTGVEQSDEKEESKKCSTWNILKIILSVFIFWGLSESIIGIWQFLAQHSIGLFWLKESLISPDISGVAKIIIGKEKYIRAYGLFPHPNILGGFLFISILATYLYKKSFQNVPRGTIWNIFLSIQIIALLLTFSKSAIIGLFLAFLYLFINTTKKKEESSTLGEMFHVEHFRKLKYYFLLSLVIFGFLLFYFQIDIISLFLRSLEERFIFLAISIKAILEHLFLGLGQGQFVLEMQKYTYQSLEAWQFQPVHNVFLLILSELGMIGLFLFVWFLMELFNNNVPLLPRETENVPRETFLSLTGVEQFNLYIKAIVLGFIFIMIFDHYLWDIQQGSLMLWMMLGFLARK